MAFGRPGSDCPLFRIAAALGAVFFLGTITTSGAQRVGVCYGRVADNLPPLDRVVSMYKSHDIGSVRIFDSDGSVLGAFANTGIEVTVGVVDNDLPALAADKGAADAWVKSNVVPYFPSTKIKYIVAGNEILSVDPALTPHVFPAMQNLYTSLRAANLQDDIKVSTVHRLSVLNASYPPSAGAFRGDVAPVMQSILGFLDATGAPLMANVYPYFSYVDNPAEISLDYATFRQADANSVGYANLFDAQLDALIYAMEKLGHVSTPVVVTESGWPSAGNPAATVSNARAFNNGLIKHVTSAGGTPKRPGVAVDVFIFAMFNENLKQGDPTEQHFGLFYPNTSSVYHVDFPI